MRNRKIVRVGVRESSREYERVRYREYLRVRYREYERERKYE